MGNLSSDTTGAEDVARGGLLSEASDNLLAARLFHALNV